MRILIDTNVLISAALSINSTPYQAYKKAVSYPNHGLICEQNVDELKRIFNKKFPNRLAALDKFLSVALLTLELVPIPTEETISEMQIRDINDRPILRAAIDAKADILLIFSALPHSHARRIFFRRQSELSCSLAAYWLR